MKAPQGTFLAALSFLTILGLGVLSCGPAVAPTAPPAAKPTPVPTAAFQLVPSPTPEAARPAPSPSPTLAPQLGPTPAAPATAGEQPKYGGVLKRNLQEGPGRLDMHQSVSYRDSQPLAAIYNLLVKIDAGDATKVIPDLAQSWEVSSDGKVYTFRLAQGVQWHDGQPLTSADVKASFDRIVFPPKGVFSPRQAYYAALDKIEAPDAQTVKFTLKRPQPSFVFMLAVPFSVIYPKHLLDKQVDLMLSPMGTGPFRFKEHIRGVSFTIEKNPNYFKKGRPYLDGMIGYVIPDPGASEAALKTKQVDMIAPGHPTLAPAVRAAIKSAFPEIVVKVQPVVVLNSFIPNFEKKPWSDIRVRKAVMLTTDQRAAIDVAKLGDAAKGGFMSPGPWSIPLPELEKLPGFGKPTEQDLAQAKKL
ncbi:MAG: ABC transporter substrate-binding protein, partial [Chloroflexota bacterium]|nr:ABC transporter substrate-binding protein [Chloroflexota bacterium]